MISIIITACKEAKTIGKAIRRILKNKIPVNYEILVLAPDEDTLAGSEKYAKENKKIKVVRDFGNGKPAALNLAFKEAKGEIFVLTDGDVFVSETAISKIIEPLKNKKIGAACSRPVSLNRRNKMLGFWSHLLTDTVHNLRKKSEKKKKFFFCSGYLYAIRSNIVESIPENILVEDGYISYLIRENGYEIAYVPEAEVYVKYPDNIKDWLKQKVRSAGGYVQLKDISGFEIRSFKTEASGVFDVLAYPKGFKEYFWTLCLLFFRLYLWALIFYVFRIKKEKSFKKIWKRVESTK